MKYAEGADFDFRVVIGRYFAAEATKGSPLRAPLTSHTISIMDGL